MLSSRAGMRTRFPRSLAVGLLVEVVTAVLLMASQRPEEGRAQHETAPAGGADANEETANEETTNEETANEETASEEKNHH